MGTEKLKYDKRFTIEYDDLSDYLRSKDPALLKEDLLQLTCDNYIIDVGYYRDCFIIFIIKDINWSKPCWKKVINNENQLITEIEMACEKVISWNY